MDENPNDSSSGGFLYALVSGVIVGAALLIVFCILRNRVPDVFQMRHLLNTWRSYNDYNGNRVGVTEPRPGKSCFGWIGPVFNTSEEEVVRKIGIDAAMFFRFFRTSFYITAILALFGAAVLMPTYGTGSQKDLPEDDVEHVQNGLRVISLSNVSPGNGRFWATVIAEIFTAAVVIYFLANDFKHYAVMRRKYRVSETPINYSVVVYDIPEEQRTESNVRDRFELLAPGQVAEVILIREPSTALKLQKKLDAAVNKREAAEYTRSVKGTDPQTRPGTCGCLMCWKSKVDSQNYWACEQDRLADEVHDQGTLAKVTPSAIVVLSNKRVANMLVQANSATNATTWHVERAPEPEAINWSAFTIPGYQAEMRSIAVAVFVFFFTLFWTIPATAIVGLFSLANLSQNSAFSWAASLIEASPFLTGLVEGLLPPVLMSVLISLIPALFRFIVSKERISSMARIEVKTRDYFFMFTLYGAFFVILIGASFFRDLEQLRKDFTKIIDLLAKEVPGTGIYFATFILVKCLVPFPLMLSGIIRVILRKIFLMLAKTERQKRKARTGGALFQYFREYGSGMLMLFLSLAFSSMAPLVPLCGMVYFGLGYIVFRYIILYTSYNEWDGGGVLFPGTYWGTMLGLILKQFVVIAVLGLKRAPGPAIVCIIPTVATICLTYIIAKRFNRIAANGSILDLHAGAAKKSDDLPPRYKSVYEQPAGKVTTYDNLNGVVGARDVYSEVEFDDPDNMDAVHSETLDDSVGYVPDPAADREDV